MSTPLSPEATRISALIQDRPGPDLGPLTPIPSSAKTPTPSTSSSLTPLVCDERAISSLLGNLLHAGGLTVAEAARRLGVDPASVRQYINGRRGRPSLLWFIRFAALCGARVVIEFPKR